MTLGGIKQKKQEILPDTEYLYHYADEKKEKKKKRTMLSRSGTLILTPHLHQNCPLMNHQGLDHLDCDR